MTERAPDLPQTFETDAQDWTRPLIERQLYLLGRLAEAGPEVALSIERQAKAAGPDADLNRLSMAYAHAAWMSKNARPPPLAGEADPEGVEGACGRRTFLSSAPDG